MKKLVLAAVVLCVVSSVGWAQFFEPGNVIFADPFGDRIVELTLNETDGVAEIVNAISWPLGDTSRRRPLGLDIDPTGTVFVGITGVPTSATEAVDFPTGRGEVLRIKPDGTQDFFIVPLNKVTFLSSFNANEVYIMSNNIPDPPSIQFRVRMSEDEVTDITEFVVSEEAGTYGEALVLPDGRVLIPGNTFDGIKVFSQDGEEIGMFTEEGVYRSLTYVEEIDKVIASGSDQVTIHRFDMDGNLEDSLNTGDFLFPNLWGITTVPGTTDIILGSHDGPIETRNFIGIFNAADFSEEPREFEIVGFENADLPPDTIFRSLFNMAVVQEPVRVNRWEIY